MTEGRKAPPAEREASGNPLEAGLYTHSSFKSECRYLRYNTNHQGGCAIKDQEDYQKAKKRVDAKIGFYIHLAVYVGVNILLIIINLVTSSQELWFKWPLMGWGIGLFFHALGVFVFTERSSIKERMIRKEMEKESFKKQ